MGKMVVARNAQDKKEMKEDQKPERHDIYKMLED